MHNILCEIINIPNPEPDGDSHVYFDPPESVKMKYPAIRYKRTKIKAKYANNSKYKIDRAYELTYIHDDPDDSVVEEILQLPYCGHDRQYKANNLYHDVFILHS